MPHPRTVGALAAATAATALVTTSAVVSAADDPPPAPTAPSEAWVTEQDIAPDGTPIGPAITFDADGNLVSVDLVGPSGPPPVGEEG